MGQEDPLKKRMVNHCWVTHMLKNLPAMQETRARPLGQEDALEKRMATKPVFLSGELHGQRT